uniref:Parathyroid hormone n=1 Tax=Monopterus albus TaxID=43700 RepID=A0A3Q3ILD7_MONAL
HQGQMAHLDYKTVFLSLCILHLCTLCEARPLRKRTVGEVQFMHNLGEHKQVQELRGIHTASAWGSRELGLVRSRLRPEEADLPSLTPDEIQYTLNFLEKLLKSKES